MIKELTLAVPIIDCNKNCGCPNKCGCKNYLFMAKIDDPLGNKLIEIFMSDIPLISFKIWELNN